jgi:predicted RNase H-like nuclease (RuvC/YqgF family)
MAQIPNILLFKPLSLSVFSDETTPYTSDDGELAGEEKQDEAPCETFERTMQELQAVRERHMAETQDARDWYQSEMESLQQDLCSKLAEKDEEIDDLQNEIRLLREKSAKDNTIIKSCATHPSVVAIGIKNIVAGKSFHFLFNL